MKKAITTLTVGVLSFASLFMSSEVEAAPPAITELHTEYSGCQGYTPVYGIWWSTSVPADKYDLDYEYWYNGSWMPSYDGTASAKMFYGSHSTPTRIRVRAKNSSGWGAFKYAKLQTVNCQDAPVVK